MKRNVSLPGREVSETPKFWIHYMITVLPKKTQDDSNVEKPAWYRECSYCAYHQAKGHTTNQCGILRNEIQQLVNDGKYVFNFIQKEENSQ